ncbi:Mbeg1-like protein [Lacticaseibacillus kribbianus]|uniref:Mbeg1-like protein n=1 Tax=Lacticaseibacillus kribbianus TaxID=2926292 RepID=UPI001CD25C49|nr:Mbeg1-like protein [Lacticaseibacillus kribbianus]
MLNLTGYAKAVGDRSFAALPVTTVDGVIFAQLAYFPFHTIAPTLNRLGDLPPASFTALTQDTWRPGPNAALLAVLAHQPRYQDIRVHDAVDRLDAELELQFSAVTFSLPGGRHVLAFRGTRAAFVDWKEDFNMAYLQTIPSQRAALAYLDKIAAHYPGTLILAGHSKGGTLATYAFAHAAPALQARIAAVYNADGPGLGTVVDPPLRARIHKLVPQTSLIGTLFDPDQEYRVIQSTAHALGQHDPFSWPIRDNAFVPVPETDLLSRYAQRSIAAWVQDLDVATKKACLDAAYALVVRTDTATFAELKDQLPQSARAILAGLRETDGTTHAQWRRAVAALIAALWAGLEPPDWHLPAAVATRLPELKRLVTEGLPPWKRA